MCHISRYTQQTTQHHRVWCAIYHVIHSKPHNITVSGVPYITLYTANHTTSWCQLCHISRYTQQTTQHHGVSCAIYHVIHSKPHNIMVSAVPYITFTQQTTQHHRVRCVIYSGRNAQQTTQHGVRCAIYRPIVTHKKTHNRVSAVPYIP